MSVLTLILDIIDSLNSFVSIMLDYQPTIFLDVELFIYLENVFYEIVLARTEAWQMGPYRQDMIIILDDIIDKYLKYFLTFFEFLQDRLVQAQNIDQQQRYVPICETIVKDLGKI